MKKILILGAGQSAPFLIDYLLKTAEKNGWFVTVADLDIANAQRAIQGSTAGTATAFDVNDAALRAALIRKADIVVNLLTPVFQHLLALDCVNFKKHMVTASYEDKRVSQLEQDAVRSGILILNEMGLDPGIDHMSAMKLIHSIRERGGFISSFLSYGGALPAPESATNPLRYCITWNARNVIRAGEAGALYLEDNHLKMLSHHNVFNRTWPVEIEGVGAFEAYPNRNSMVYQDIFGLGHVKTMIRGTLRFPGWSETWQQIVKLGLANETMPLPDLHGKSYRDFILMFLPLHVSGSSIESRVANHLNINPTGRIMENLRWLGLFSDETINGHSETAADVMTNLLKSKLALPENGRDMVILRHELVAEFPGEKNAKEHIVATLTDYGEPGGFTAIARTVGMPAAIATKLILQGKLPITGCHIPTTPAIYEPVMAELKQNGIVFDETVKRIA